MNRPISTRVKAMLATLGAAGAATITAKATGYDYTELVGPTWSPLATLGIGTAAAYAVRETAFGRFLRSHGQTEAADLIAAKRPRP